MTTKYWEEIKMKTNFSSCNLINNYMLLYLLKKIIFSFDDTYMLSLICFARMDFSEQYHIKDEA